MIMKIYIAVSDEYNVSINKVLIIFIQVIYMKSPTYFLTLAINIFLGIVIFIFLADTLYFSCQGNEDVQCYGFGRPVALMS